MAGNFVPPTQSSTLGKSDNRWAGGFFDKLAVKTLEVIGGGTENDAQPATVGWVKSKFQDLFNHAIKLTGVKYNFGKEGENGYIYFGSLFGGLTIELLYFNTNNSNANNEQEQVLPIALGKVFYGHICALSYKHDVLPVSKIGLTPDKGRIKVKFSVGREKSIPVYGIIVGTI